SISRCEVTPTFFRNLRNCRLNTSSSNAASAIARLLLFGMRFDGVGGRRAPPQPHAEGAPLADPRLHGNASAVALHQAVADRQAEPGAAARIGGEKRIEDALELVA